MQQEIWKDIEGYEGLYQVSNLGRVRSVDRIILRSSTPQFSKGKNISQQPLNSGYMVVSLWNKKKRKAFTVHRLVANAFLPLQQGKDEVDHINGIRTDNRVNNLRWCNRKENVNFPIARSKYLSSNKERIEHIRMAKAKHSLKLVQLTLDGTIIKEWNSVKQASKSLGIQENNVYAVCIGKRKSTGGYKWKYIKDMFK